MVEKGSQLENCVKKSGGTAKKVKESREEGCEEGRQRNRRRKPLARRFVPTQRSRGEEALLKIKSLRSSRAPMRHSYQEVLVHLRKSEGADAR